MKKKAMVMVSLWLCVGVVCGQPNRDERPKGPPPHWNALKIADQNQDGTLTSIELDQFISTLSSVEGELNQEKLQELLEEHRPKHRRERGQGGEHARGHRRDSDQSRGEHGPPHHGRGNPLDFNHDGYVEARDLQAIFDVLDEDQSGTLSNDEFPQPPRHRRN